MPRGRRSSSDLVMFSSTDPTQLVNWLCEKYGLQAVLQAVSQFRPSGPSQGAAAKGASKKRGRRPGRPKGSGKRGRPKGSKNKANAEGGNS